MSLRQLTDSATPFSLGDNVTWENISAGKLNIKNLFVNNGWSGQYGIGNFVALAGYGRDSANNPVPRQPVELTRNGERNYAGTSFLISAVAGIPLTFNISNLTTNDKGAYWFVKNASGFPTSPAPADLALQYINPSTGLPVPVVGAINTLYKPMVGVNSSFQVLLC